MVVSCGFESTDTWSFCYSGSKYASSDTGNQDVPSGQRVLSGESSWQVSGITTSVLTFSDILLSGWTNASISYRVSSTGTTTGVGHGASDQVVSYVSETTSGLQSASPVITLTGNGNAVWGYESGAKQVTATAGGASLVRKPGGSGLRTTDGYTNFKMAIPSTMSSAALKISIANSSKGTYWNLDDVVLSGDATESHACRWSGGAGLWTTALTATGWIDQTHANAVSAWNNTRGDNALFYEPGSTLTVAKETTVAARSLTFAVDGYRITAADPTSSRLALTNGGSGGAGANTIEVTHAGQTAYLDVALIANPGVGLTKTGDGVLQIDAVGSTFFGDVDIRQGTLRLGSAAWLSGCSSIRIDAGATLDLTAIDGYHLGSVVSQTLDGTGVILGNLWIDALGEHNVGSSPGVQCVEGDYGMAGALLVEAAGSQPGDGATGYDQIHLLAGDAHDVSLSGELSLTWSGDGWASDGQRLWIVRNDTVGELSGTFSNYAQSGLWVGRYDGCDWYLYYGADAEHNQLTGGNDVVLAAAAVPEPGCLLLLLSAAAVFGFGVRRRV
ncbi:MAG: PEP-CTERM sorting domain-containing protein [Thermoguttaceae bacterium]